MTVPQNTPSAAKSAYRRLGIFAMGVKQFSRLLIALIFCAVLFSSFLGDIDSIVWRAIVGLITGLIFFVVAYTSMNGYGTGDGNQVRFQQAPRRLTRGLWSSLISAIPFLLVNLWFALTYVPPAASNLKVVFNLANCPVYAVTVFTGLENSAAIWFNVFLMPVLVTAAGFAGYYFGDRGISVMERLLYRSQKKNEDAGNSHDYKF